MVQAPAACDVNRHDVPLARLEKKFAGQSARSLSVPPSAYAVHFVGPGRPCLVRNWITPLAASVPYSAAAEGPFTTSTASKSSGLKSFKRSEEHTSELQSQSNLVCRLLLEKKKKQRLAKSTHRTR